MGFPLHDSSRRAARHTFDLSALVLRTIARLGDAVRVPIATDLSGSLSLVSGVPDLIDAALETLLRNSAAAMDGLPNPMLRVRTGFIQQCTRAYLDRTFFGASRLPGAYAYLEVFDSGSGLSEQERATFFDATISARQRGHETIRAAALAHGGAVEIQSSSTRGVTVRLLLSLARSQSGRRIKLQR